MLHAGVDNRAGPCTNYVQHADIGIGQGATPLVCQQYNAQEIQQMHISTSGYTSSRCGNNNPSAVPSIAHYERLGLFYGSDPP